MSEQQEFSLGPFDGELAARVAEARGHLSGADQQILAYLTDNPDGLAFHTAESLSTKAGVSAGKTIPMNADLITPSSALSARGSQEECRRRDFRSRCNPTGLQPPLRPADS